MTPLRLPRFTAVGILALLACDAKTQPAQSAPSYSGPVPAVAVEVAAAPPPPSATAAPPPADDLAAVRREAEGWRAAHLLIDLHEHIDPTPDHVARAVKIQDAVGIGLAVNLSGGVVTLHGKDPRSFEYTMATLDRIAPGRFLEYMNLDYSDWEKPDFSAR